MNVCLLFCLWWHAVTWWVAKTSVCAQSKVNIYEVKPEGPSQFPMRFMDSRNGSDKEEKFNNYIKNNFEYWRPCLQYHTTMAEMKKWIYITGISCKKLQNYKNQTLCSLDLIPPFC